MFPSFFDQHDVDEDNVIKGNRHRILQKIQTKFILSPHQARIAYPADEVQHVNRRIAYFETRPLPDNFPKISLPLPLPDMTGEWVSKKLVMIHRVNSKI